MLSKYLLQWFTRLMEFSILRFGFYSEFYLPNVILLLHFDFYHFQKDLLVEDVNLFISFDVGVVLDEISKAIKSVHIDHCFIHLPSTSLTCPFQHSKSTQSRLSRRRPRFSQR